MATQLEQLKAHTKVVADTGDFASMTKFKPEVSLLFFWFLKPNKVFIVHILLTCLYIVHVVDKQIIRTVNNVITIE